MSWVQCPGKGQGDFGKECILGVDCAQSTSSSSLIRLYFMYLGQLARHESKKRVRERPSGDSEIKSKNIKKSPSLEDGLKYPFLV